MRILAVDDMALVRKIIKKVVTALGCEFLEAADGEEAFTILYRDPAKVDLILLDWNMPNMDGLEFLKMLRSKDRFKDTPVILITTENEKEKIVAAALAGVKSYLAKPFVERELVRKILETAGPEFSEQLLAKCFSIALTKVLGAAAGGVIMENGVGQEEALTPGDPYWGQVLALGQTSSLAIFYMSEASATGLTALLSPVQHAGIGREELLQGVAVFLKRVASEAKTAWERMQMPWGLSLPLALAGKDATRIVSLEREGQVVTMRCQAGEIQLSWKIYCL